MSALFRLATALGLAVVGIILIVLGIQAILIAMNTPPPSNSCAPSSPLEPPPFCSAPPLWQTTEGFYGILSTLVGMILVLTGATWAAMLRRRVRYSSKARTPAHPG